MARKSIEYWASPASREYEAQLDHYYDLGAQTARNGEKPNLRGIIGSTFRCMYMAGYRRALSQAAA